MFLPSRKKIRFKPIIILVLKHWEDRVLPVSYGGVWYTKFTISKLSDLTNWRLSVIVTFAFYVKGVCHERRHQLFSID